MSDSMYGPVKVDKRTTEIPADLPLSDLRLSTTFFEPGSWREEFRGLSKEVLEEFANRGFHTVEDLPHDWTMEAWEEVPGVGDVTARRLRAVISNATDKPVRYNRFPWEIDVKVIVPNKHVAGIQELGETDAKELVENLFYVMEDELEIAMRKIRKKKLEEKREALQEAMEGIQERLRALQ